MTPKSDQTEAIAEEAYIYAFPMLMGYRYLFGSYLAKGAPSYRAPLNTLVSDSRALDWRFKDVITPNADTPYSFAALDLRAEPYVLSVPSVTDRYYVMQLEDLLGFNEHYVGTRVTGMEAGSYLLVGPRWSGDVPQDVTHDASLRDGHRVPHRPHAAAGTRGRVEAAGSTARLRASAVERVRGDSGCGQRAHRRLADVGR